MNVVMMNLSISILSVLLITPRICLTLNKNNSNDCDITNAYEEKTVEAVL